jgi:hypothetical protein
VKPVSEFVIVEPDVERIVEGLRDTGYDFNTAVADIIDNSIAAGADMVHVHVVLDYGGQVYVSVADNGVGMDREDLINAMKYGSKKRLDPASLGKFGLGLKTASSAFSRRLVVVSRPVSSTSVLKAIWDLDDLKKSDAWRLQIDTPAPEELAVLEEVAKDHSGTAVIWDRVDRLLTDYKRPDGKAMKNALKRIESILSERIAMIYQRFLDPRDQRARNVVIRLNGSAVLAWDPFCLAEIKKPVSERTVPVMLPSGQESSFLVRAFILPRKEEFSSDENRIAARISNDLQGIYVYRENRLIHGPDWLGMFKMEPHFSLLRVELSFTHEVDEAFQVDIKKSRILLNTDLYDWLRDQFLVAPRREAENRSRKGAASSAKGVAALLHKASNNAIGMRVASLATPKVVTRDLKTGAVDLENNSGHQKAKLRIVVPDSPSAVHLSIETSLDDGVLWEPTLINGTTAVTLNASHPYYIKAYLPNEANSPLIQALDFLLWSLAQAELNNVSEENRDAFQEFRIEVSRNLKKLVADLPDPVEAVVN